MAMQNTKQTKTLIALTPLLLLLSSCKAIVDDDARIVGQSKGQAAVVKRVDGGEMRIEKKTSVFPPAERFAKVLAVTMTVDKDNAVTLSNPRVYYGKPPNNIGNPAMFTARALDRQGAIKLRIPLWDPRWTFVWSDDKGRDYVDLADNADSEVIVLFQPGFAALDIVKDVKDRKSLATINVTTAFEKFCRKNQQDPDCVKKTDDNSDQKSIVQ
jgi:hypothetical protein